MKFRAMLIVSIIGLVPVPFNSASAEADDSDKFHSSAISANVGGDLKEGEIRVQPGLSLVAFGAGNSEFDGEIRVLGGMTYAPLAKSTGMNVDAGVNVYMNKKAREKTGLFWTQRMRLKGSVDTNEHLGNNVDFKFSQGVGVSMMSKNVKFATGPLYVALNMAGNSKFGEDGCIGPGWMASLKVKDRALVQGEHIACLTAMSESKVAHADSKSNASVDVLFSGGYFGAHISDVHRGDVTGPEVALGARNHDITGGVHLGVVID